MCGKYLILSLIYGILIINFGETESVREPRDYGVSMPLASTVKVPGLNLTSSGNRTLHVPLIRVPEPEEEPWEPLACSQCLNPRYLVHYLARGCKAVNISIDCRKPCPKYFECPKIDHPIDVDVKGCEYKGKVYKFREQVEVSNPCQKGCFCDKYQDIKNKTQSTLTCANVDCFNGHFSWKPNCFQVWEEGNCCSIEKCLTPEEESREHKCFYDGKQYHLGQTIYPKEDPCLECICQLNWNQTNPLKSRSCKQRKCDLTTNDNFKAGCLPIYHEGVCCPIEYFCTPPKEEQCKFNGKYYLIGERLDINRERTECICRIPPDFTCIEKMREVVPIPFTISKVEEPEDYVKKFQTLPRVNITNSSNDPLANIPELTNESKCPPFIPEGLTCAGVKCSTVIDENGCQACKCEEPCPLPKCRKGCTLFATTPGVCPKCKCD